MTVPPLFPARTRENDSLARRYLLATLLTAVTILGARFSVHLPFTPVPLTGQVFPVLLSGLLLGSRWGAVAQAQYLLLGLLGAPVFAEGKSGPAALAGVTAGYLWSYPIAAFVTGRLAERAQQARNERGALTRQLLACAAGIAIIYGLGCAWLALLARQPLGTVLVQGALIFLPWDGVKALAAIALANGLRRRR